jgi:uncharacterized protein (TIGR00288 family)
MTAQFARGPYRGRAGGGPAGEPHAALLIDFDNVTMGIRSDITKELKNLLNSDIIKGKVAVQRAYADWRRYPQYIVPLAESSVDLIFAPAYGSAKKNATDIRLAIDAVELVFTRPEIGTIILLSGDSDFSSLVLKLKEYGKYVIGVGIRESASDLLVQNCDEYYSYSAITGLTRAGDEAPAVSEDPWELVDMALRQMIENADVLRSDRLKQVILELDPAFDEKALGFQKFNKFLQEAATRGILSLRKQENGQFEVGPPGIELGDGAEPVERADRVERGGRGRRGRRGRGRREDREDRTGAVELADAAEAPHRGGPQYAPDTAAVELDLADAAAAAAVPAPAAAAGEVVAGVPADPDVAAPVSTRDDTAAGNLQRSHRLLYRALTDLTRKAGPVVRDSDVKRRMLELEPGWNEASAGFSKFSRFLRRAHDDRVITLRKGENGNYDVLLGDGDIQIEEEPRGGGRERVRGGRRDRTGRAGRPALSEEIPVAAVPAARGVPWPVPAAPAGQGAIEVSAAAVAPAPAPAERAAAVQGPAAAVPPPVPLAPVTFRRGSRGRPLAGGPPPLLEGQTIAPLRARPAEPVAEPVGEPAAVQPVEVAAEPVEARRRGARKPAGAERPARGRPAVQESKRAVQRGRPPAPGTKEEALMKGFDAASFGLPTSPAAVASYIATEYRGIGPKTVDALVERVGAGRVFETLETRPDLVREVLGISRGNRLLDAWADDIAFRRANRAPTAQSAVRTAGAARGRARPPGRGGGPKSGGGGGGGAGAARGGSARRPRRGGRRGPGAGG